jgi:hypothetical protein
MDYGRRVYGTNSKKHITFMSEITDKYVQSIGGKFTAGTKQPYLYDNYHTMQYLYNQKKRYLGGIPATLEDLGLTSAIAPDASNLNTLFSVTFDGTYADLVTGLLPIATVGNNSLTTYGGQPCVLLHIPKDDDLAAVTIFWCPIFNINKNSFSLSWNILGGADCLIVCGIGGGMLESIEYPGNITVGFQDTGTVVVSSTDQYGTDLINYETPTSYFTDNVWHSFNVTFNNGILTVKLNNNIILTQALDVSFVSNITTIGIGIFNNGSNSVDAYFDSIKVENVT